MKKMNSSVAPSPGPSGGKNHTIVIVRVFAMFMIIGCHLSTWLGSNTLAMILNVGVYVFLLISGMLYAKKQITNGLAFMIKRWAKLCIPMYYLVAFLLIYYFLNSDMEAVKAIPTYLLNLQGIGFLICGLKPYQIKGLGHLWFLSAIMSCYFLLLAVKKIETDKFWNSDIHILLSFALLFLADVLLACLVRVQLHYFISFFTGYSIGKRGMELTQRKYLVNTSAMACAMAFRLFGRKYADGTILYNDLIVPFTHLVLAVWIYQSIEFISQKAPAVTKSFAQCPIMSWLEKLSMYLYMTHYLFLTGPIHVNNPVFPKLMQILLFAFGTLGSAILLQIFSENAIQQLCRLPLRS